MTIQEIQNLMPWSEDQKSSGGKSFCKAPIPAGSPFWAKWKANKEELKNWGVSVRKDVNGKWEVLWWKEDLETLEQRRRAREEALAARNAERKALVSVLPANLEERLQELIQKEKLLSFQIPSVRQLVNSLIMFAGGVDTSDTGTGKTYVSLAAAVILNRPVFVICPKTVIPSWKKVARHFGIEIQACNYELLRRGQQPALKLVNEGRRDEKYVWRLTSDTLLIFDECHRLKNHRTYNCKMGLAAIDQGYNVIGLSATAADNPTQMKFVGRLCRLFDAQGFYKWTMENGCAKGRFGLEFVGGNKHLQQIHEEIFPLHGTRIRIKDLGDTFPKTLITADCYDLNGDTEKLNSVYAEMDEEISRIEAKEEEDSTKQACILTAILRARQRAEILKVPAMATMAEDLIEEGNSVAIFCNFDDTVDALMARLKTDCVVRGGQSAKERQYNIERFQALRRPRAAIHNPTHSAQDAKQALGRVNRAAEPDAPPADPSIEPSPIIICNNRAGGVGIGLHDLNGSPSIQRIFFAAGTIEESVCRQVQDKINRIDTLNDGDLSLTGEIREQPFCPEK